MIYKEIIIKKIIDFIRENNFSKKEMIMVRELLNKINIKEKFD